MQLNKTVKKGLIGAAVAAALLGASAWFILKFSFSTSFWYQGFCGYDSGIFQLIGKYWAEGTLPYAELFDHKGPLIFFINALGYWLRGRAGLLVLQTVNLAFSVVCLYKLGRVYLNRPLAVGMAGAALVYLARTFDEGNMTEEYSLPFLALSLWLAVRYFKKAEESGGADHPWQYAAVYGFSFGAILLLRVTSALSICCFVLVICAQLMGEGRWKNLGANALGFLGGFGLMVGPFTLYFAAKGILSEALYGTLWYNVFYSAKFSPVAYYSNNVWAENTIRRLLLDFGAPVFVLAALCVLSLIAKPKTPLAWAGLLSAAANGYLLLMSRPYLHYYMILTPFLPLCACLVARLWRQGQVKKLAKGLAMGGCAVLVFYMGSVALRLPSWEADGLMPHYPWELADYNNIAHSMAAVIPPEERDSVLAYNVEAQWYLTNEIKPCLKYFANQDWQSGSDPAMQAEIARLFTETPPKWVVAGDVSHPVVAQLLAQDYEAVSGRVDFYKFKGYTLYRRKG